MQRGGEVTRSVSRASTIQGGERRGPGDLWAEGERMDKGAGVFS